MLITPSPPPERRRPYPPCTGTIHAPNARTRRTPNPTAGLHAHHTQHTHKTPLTAAAQPALSHGAKTPQPGSDTHASQTTDTPAQPRTHPHHNGCKQPKPPEASCAPRSAPEPDSQSPKNTYARPPQPGQTPNKHASNPRISQKPTPAYPISQPLNPMRQRTREQPIFSMMTPMRPADTPGGGGRDRTDDPLLAKQVLSQLSYAPRTNTHTRTPGTRPKHAARQPHGAALVGQGGLEPPTPRLSSVCSNQLSY